jgi:hypothetical protein
VGVKKSHPALIHRVEVPQLQQIGPQAVDTVIARQYAADVAWLAAGARCSLPSDEKQTKGVSTEALNALLAQYGV